MGRGIETNKGAIKVGYRVQGVQGYKDQRVQGCKGRE